MEYKFFIISVIAVHIHCISFPTEPIPENVQQFFTQFQIDKENEHLGNDFNFSPGTDFVNKLTFICIHVNTLFDVLNDSAFNCDDISSKQHMESEIKRVMTDISNISVDEATMRNKLFLNNQEIAKLTDIYSNTKTLLDKLMDLFHKKYGYSVL